MRCRCNAAKRNNAITSIATHAPVEAAAAAGQRGAIGALMFGNFITGLAVLAPAAMLVELAAGLAVTTRETGLLVTFGAVVLCFASPIAAWLTAALDRRMLLSLTLLAVGIAHVGMAAAGNYAVVLAVRLAMLAVAAIFTPQAASTVTLMVPQARRSTAISTVFLGWSLSIAAGLPIVAFAAGRLGWRAAFAGLGVAALLGSVATAACVPKNLRAAPLSPRSWTAIARDGLIVRLLAITALWMSGYFVIFAYLGPCLVRLGGASTAGIAACFATVGAMGFLGNLAATRLVGVLGGFITALVFLLSMFLGACVWAFGPGSLALMFAGAALLGFGFAAFNSVTQARLVTAAPALAGASVALNTSCVYIGQAVGSGVAVWLFSRGLLTAMGFCAVGFMVAAFAVLIGTRTLPPSSRAARERTP